MKIWQIIGLILLGLGLGYFIGKSFGNTQEEKERNAKLGLWIGFGIAAIIAAVCNTVKYTLFNRGKIVYHGIAFDRRFAARINEHRISGKKFDRVTNSLSMPRQLARVIERNHIKLDAPKYNIQHNC